MNRIKAERLSRKLSQDELAKMLNIDRSTIARWESGEMRPRASKLLKLSEIFDCSVDDLLCDNVLIERTPEILPPASDMLNESQELLIEHLKNAGYNDEKMKKLVNFYVIGDNKAVDVALALGKIYKEYLPIGGNAIENAEDLIRVVELYLAKREIDNELSEATLCNK